MSSNRWVNPVNNNLLRDLQDNLLPSGSIEIYEAGTSTPLTVYANPDQTGSLGSCLNCDAYGLIPDFHLPENTQFKVVAYDDQDGSSGTGSVKWTRDYLYTSDKSVETRLTAVETTVNGLTGLSRNGCVNGGMRVAQNSVPNLTSSFLEGKASRLFGRVTNVTAGTLTTGQSTNYVSNSYGLFSGVSTSAAAVVEAQIRIAAGEAARFVDEACVFSCLVRQDTTASVNYTITVKTPTTTADDFSSLTTIGTSSATAVANATDTRLSFSVSDMGDCSKGIAIEVSASLASSITTKNFRITEAQFETGATRTAFSELIYDAAVAACGKTATQAITDDSTNQASTAFVQAFAKASGRVIQVAANSTNSFATFTTPVIPFDDTIPQNTEGVDLSIPVQVTTLGSSDKIILEFSGMIDLQSGCNGTVAFFVGSTADAVGATGFESGSAEGRPIHAMCIYSPGAAGTYTFNVHVGVDTGTGAYNGLSSGVRRYYGKSQCTLKATVVGG